MAHRLDHLHRDQLVKAALQLAVVFTQYGDAIFQAGLAHPGAGVLVLFPRDRGGGNATAVFTGGMDGQAAPAGATEASSSPVLSVWNRAAEYIMVGSRNRLKKSLPRS